MGEQYNPNAYTAAAQLEIRGKFGGIQYGRLYRPAYGLGEYGGKKIIVRFNDVGPLRPGRKFDLSRAAMTYFDGTLDRGLLPGFRMTPLPLDRSYPEGPVTDQELAALGIESDVTDVACAIYSGRAGARNRQHLAEADHRNAPRREGKAASGAPRTGAKTIKTAAAAQRRREEESQSPGIEGRQTATEECGVGWQVCHTLGQTGARAAVSPSRRNALVRRQRCDAGSLSLRHTPAAPPSARGSCAPSSVPFGCSTTAPAWPMVSE